MMETIGKCILAVMAFSLFFGFIGLLVAVGIYIVTVCLPSYGFFVTLPLMGAYIGVVLALMLLFWAQIR